MSPVARRWWAGQFWKRESQTKKEAARCCCAHYYIFQCFFETRPKPACSLVHYLINALEPLNCRGDVVVPLSAPFQMKMRLMARLASLKKWCEIFGRRFRTEHDARHLHGIAHKVRGGWTLGLLIPIYSSRNKTADHRNTSESTKSLGLDFWPRAQSTGALDRLLILLWTAGWMRQNRFRPIIHASWGFE